MRDDQGYEIVLTPLFFLRDARTDYVTDTHLLSLRLAHLSDARSARRLITPSSPIHHPTFGPLSSVIAVDIIVEIPSSLHLRRHRAGQVGRI